MISKGLRILSRLKTTALSERTWLQGPLVRILAQDINNIYGKRPDKQQNMSSNTLVRRRLNQSAAAIAVYDKTKDLAKVSAVLPFKRDVCEGDRGPGHWTRTPLLWVMWP